MSLCTTKTFDLVSCCFRGTFFEQASGNTTNSEQQLYNKNCKYFGEYPLCFSVVTACRLTNIAGRPLPKAVDHAKKPSPPSTRHDNMDPSSSQSHQVDLDTELKKCARILHLILGIVKEREECMEHLRKQCISLKDHNYTPEDSQGNTPLHLCVIHSGPKVYKVVNRFHIL